MPDSNLTLIARLLSQSFCTRDQSVPPLRLRVTGRPSVLRLSQTRQTTTLYIGKCRGCAYRFSTAQEGEAKYEPLMESQSRHWNSERVPSSTQLMVHANPRGYHYGKQQIPGQRTNVAAPKTKR